MTALAPSVRPMAYGIVVGLAGHEVGALGGQTADLGRDAVDGDGAHGRHDGRPVRAQRRERADRVEADGRVADVGRPRARSRPAASSGGSWSRGAANRAAMPAASSSAPVAGSRRSANGPSTRSTPSMASMAAPRSRMRWTLAASVGEPSTVGEDDDRRGLAGAEVARQGDRGLAALDAARQDRCVRDALLEAQERRAEDAAGTRGSGSSTATGRAMTQWAIRSQRDSRAMSAATPVGRPKARRIRSRSPATPPALTRGPSMPRTAGRKVRA